MSGLTFLLPVAVLLFFWILVIRPQTRRQRELSSLQDSLALGDVVVLTSGIFGTVARVEEDRIGVEVSTGVVITVAKGAIGIVNPPPPEPTAVDGSSYDHLENDKGADGAAAEEKD